MGAPTRITSWTCNKSSRLKGLTKMIASNLCVFLRVLVFSSSPQFLEPYWTGIWELSSTNNYDVGYFLKPKLSSTLNSPISVGHHLELHVAITIYRHYPEIFCFYGYSLETPRIGCCCGTDHDSAIGRVSFLKVCLISRIKFIAY